jgi:hypothetical protein
MAEHVASNHKTTCTGTLMCASCGTKSKLSFKPTSGRGSQRTEGHQCPGCRKVVCLIIFGDGRITGADIKQKRSGPVEPTAPPADYVAPAPRSRCSMCNGDGVDNYFRQCLNCGAPYRPFLPEA